MPKNVSVPTVVNNFRETQITNHEIETNIPQILRNMKWATRKNVKVDRMACVWLILRHIDADAEIVYVDEPEIPALTESGWNTFDAENAKYRHDDDPVLGKYGLKCSFQIILDAYGDLAEDAVLKFMGEIVYAADIGHKKGEFDPKEGYGLWALAHGLAITIPNDAEKLPHALAIYDALYAYCRDVSPESASKVVT
jgi:hypothetical protein